MHPKKVYVVGGANQYASPFTKAISSFEESDIVLFSGGADVNPYFYGEDKGKHTSINHERDLDEIEVFKDALELGKPMIGICRGSQFLTVMNGGKLIQHVDNHGIYGTHKIAVMLNGAVKEYDITSTHHQMMFPYNLKKEDYKIIGWSFPKRSNTYLNGKNQEIELPDNFVEPEIVFYPKSKCLCIQGHPEHMLENEVTIKMLRGLVKRFLDIELG